MSTAVQKWRQMHGEEQMQVQQRLPWRSVLQRWDYLDLAEELWTWFDQKHMFHRSMPFALCSRTINTLKNEPSVLDCTLKFPLGLKSTDTFLRLNTACLCMAECVCVYVCAAVCEPSCGAHGTCVEPNRCQCRDGWNGRHCNKSKTTSFFPRPRY